MNESSDGEVMEAGNEIMNEGDAELFENESLNCKSTQTDMTMEDLTALLNRLDITTTENDKIRAQMATLNLDESSFQGDDKKTKYFTGLSNFKLLQALHKLVSPYLSKNSKPSSLPTFKQLLLMLMKLRLDLPFQYLSYRLCFFSVVYS